MKVVSVWNPKGGQGKSTIAVNLAAAAVHDGLTTIVIDRDEQGTSTLYGQQQLLPFKVVGSYPAKAPDVDLILIDHMANDRRVPEPNLIVMPVIPKRSQFAAYIEARQMGEDAGKQIITVVINGDQRRSEERRVINALKNDGAIEIRASGVFGRADSEYRSIFDQALNRTYGIDERRDEVLTLLEVIKNTKAMNKIRRNTNRVS